MRKVTVNQDAIVRVLLLEPETLAEAASASLVAERRQGERVRVVDRHLFFDELLFTENAAGVRSIYHEDELG